MKIFELVLLYLLKLFGTNNFWSNLRSTDSRTYRTARHFQRTRLKLTKCDLDISFLKACTLKGITPKFTNWKTLKHLKFKERFREQKRILHNALREKYRKKKTLSNTLEQLRRSLQQSTTILKFGILIMLVKCDEQSTIKSVSKIHKKKFDALLNNLKRVNDIATNPNDIVINLTNETLTNDELDVLKLGLNHGIALRPKEPQMIAATEVLWHQIVANNMLKNNRLAGRVKTALRAFTYSILDLDLKRFSQDSKIVKIIQNLRNRFAILKPDKGNGTVLMYKSDYNNSLERIFNDRSKFKIVNQNDSISKLQTLQGYLNKLLKRNEISEEDKNLMRTKSANVARAHGLCKIHKQYDSIPPFRPIIDTTGTAYSNVGRYLSRLLYPLTLNEFSIKDSFCAAEKIKTIPKYLFDEGYQLISFDAVSLFTNVPLKHTIDIILKRIYDDNVIQTTLTKRTLKKLILDSCQKTIFSFNNKYYKQMDGVSMGSSLGPVLANIIMTELETIIIKPLMNDGTIKFYIRYVDDTLVLVKPDNIDKILNLLNSFHKNLKFTVDKFENCSVHFLDLLIMDNLDIDIYRKKHIYWTIY